MTFAIADILTETLQLDRVNIPGYQGLQQVCLQQGKIADIRPMASARQSDAHSLDFGEDWLSLGGVDLQINGCLGLAFPDLTPATAPKLQEVSQFLWQQGVDAYLPTLVTTSVEKFHAALNALAHVKPSDLPSAQILGAHLEGPCLNPEKRGAHPAEFLQPLNVATLTQILGDYAEQVKVVTLAPELDSSGQAIAYLRDHDIVVSLGHSLATAEQAQMAFEQGATMVTHAFNAMPGLHHRAPGLLAAALLNPSVWSGFIADGQHIDPLMLKLLFNMTQGERLFLVSDALAPLGLPDGQYPWDSRTIVVEDGTARLLDGTLSGTTHPLLTAVQNLVAWEVCSVESAIVLATEAPRQAIGLPGLGPGQPAAQLLRWHQSSVGQLHWQRLSTSLTPTQRR